MDSMRAMNHNLSSVQQIVLDLEGQIVRGDLAEGARLPSERALADMYGVSRPTIREALHRLADRQLLRIEQGRGSFVTERSLVRAAGALGPAYRRGRVTPREVVEARIALEGEAAELAADRSTRAEIGALAKTLARLEAADDRIECVRLDLAFHFGIIRTAHNPVIETMFASIAPLAVELMLRSVNDERTSRRSHPLHGVIYQAIADGDGATARSAVVDHLSVARETYGEDFERSLDEMAHHALERIAGPHSDLDAVLASVLPTALQSPSERHGSAS